MICCLKTSKHWPVQRGDGGEEVQIPCAQEKRRSCTFKSVDADGNEYVNTWNDYVKAG